MLFRSSTQICNTNGAARQSGVALLTFMLIMVVSASTFLLTKLNAQIKHSVYRPDSSIALQEVRDVMTAWAVNHEFNPGTLPMPDRNGDGNYDGNADCFNGAISPNLLLGRIPWQDIPSPCRDSTELPGLSIYVTDRYGEHLWYAVSKNLVYETPEYPFISPGLLNKNTEWLTVRDHNGTVLSDRVAFLLIAPGPVLLPYSNCGGFSYAGQDRGGAAPDIDNYLDEIRIGGTTYSNADYDEDFIIYPDSLATNGNNTQEQCDHFNDQLLFVTIDELMEKVSKRALNETSNLLSTYHNSYGVLPWLSPYTDPKAEIPVIRGESDNAIADTTKLIDTGIDFVSAGVQFGDVLRNISDGSIGIVNNVGIPGGFPDNNTLTVSDLLLGSGNDFNSGDEYYITPQSSLYMTGFLSGTATVGSTPLILEDSSKNFLQIGIKPGDIIENITDNISRGVITDVTTDTISVNSLAGGILDNNFDLGDSYFIRSNRGIAGAGSSGLSLQDSNVDFIALGVVVGDVVINVSDGSYGRVDTVVANTISVGDLTFGTENDFDPGESYALIRHDAVAGTRQGRLAFHHYGEVFPTGFNIDWDISSVAPVINTQALYTNTGYATGLTGKIAASSGTLGTLTITEDNGQCIWSGDDIAECIGYYMDTNFPIQGRLTSGSSTNVITDSNADFLITDIKRGDKVLNFDEELMTVTSGTADAGSGVDILVDTSKNFNSLGIVPYYHLFNNDDDGNAKGYVTEIINNNTLRIVNFPAEPAMDIDPGENYRIRTVEEAVVTSVDSSTQLTTSRLRAAQVDFDANDLLYQVNQATGQIDGVADFYIAPGSFLIQVGADFSDVEIGDIVENLDDNAFGIVTFVDVASDLLEAQLYASDGTTRSYNTGEAYRIYYNHDVHQRRYEFMTRFSNTPTVYDTAGVRKRDVCLGYDANCTTITGNVTLPEQSSMITIRDLDINGLEVGRAVVDVPLGGSAGTIRLANIDYYLREGGGEIPEWYVRNKWHQYIFIAYDDDEEPGSGLACTAGVDCLSLNIRDVADTIVSTRDDIRALVMITSDDLATQSWPDANITDYFDDVDNIDFNDVFDRNPISPTFNDSLRIAVSCAADPTRLCWSN
jgi:hypothetical protein